mmetsp:Transcript_8891/g.16411  ORF Transcript_8891/g.16411 Transcript_8891/m.16411 type:complete len:235 (+) Transcript_8891:1402-2106(+)
MDPLCLRLPCSSSHRCSSRLQCSSRCSRSRSSCNRRPRRRWRRLPPPRRRRKSPKSPSRRPWSPLSMRGRACPLHRRRPTSPPPHPNRQWKLQSDETRPRRPSPNPSASPSCCRGPSSAPRRPRRRPPLHQHRPRCRTIIIIDRPSRWVPSWRTTATATSTRSCSREKSFTTSSPSLITLRPRRPRGAPSSGRFCSWQWRRVSTTTTTTCRLFPRASRATTPLTRRKSADGGSG